MKHLANLTLILITLVLFTSCGSGETKNYDSPEAMIKDAQSQVELISLETLKTKMDKKDKIFLIDCREEEEYDISCIPGAINIPRGLLEFIIGDKVSDRKGEVIIYCSNGERSSLAAIDLPKLKFSNVKVLESGFDAWKEKYPEAIEKEPKGDNNSVKKAAKPSGGCGG